MSTHDSSKVRQNKQAVVKIDRLQKALAAERSAHRRTRNHLNRIFNKHRSDDLRRKFALQRPRTACDKRKLAVNYECDFLRAERHPHPARIVCFSRKNNLSSLKVKKDMT